jgi:hypothetical protein
MIDYAPAQRVTDGRSRGQIWQRSGRFRVRRDGSVAGATAGFASRDAASTRYAPKSTGPALPEPAPPPVHLLSEKEVRHLSRRELLKLSPLVLAGAFAVPKLRDCLLQPCVDANDWDRGPGMLRPRPPLHAEGAGELRPRSNTTDPPHLATVPHICLHLADVGLFVAWSGPCHP